MQDIDELLKKQRDLILQMDQHHQRQMNSLHERISRVQNQIQLLQNTNKENNDLIQLSKDDSATKSTIGMSKSFVAPSQAHATSASQEKLPKLNTAFPR